jgi:hypothetical protein
MQKEARDQSGNGKFSVIHRSKFPKGATVLPAAWQMKCKHNVKTQKVKKWKAQVNVDGSRMKKGVHCSQTHTPVASWNSTCQLLATAAARKWRTKQSDFALAFPQARVERETRMKVPKGFDLG